MKLISREDQHKIFTCLASIWISSSSQANIHDFGKIVENIAEISFLVGGETGSFQCEKIYTKMKLERDRQELERRT